VCFGLAAAAYIELADRIRRVLGRVVGWPPLRPFIGGAAAVGLIALVGRDYTGMSLPLIDRALDGAALSFAVFALKIVFTALAIGSSFPGGEVTPLFAIGATLGAALAEPLNVSGPLIAAVGFAAVFAAASNTPIAGTVMGVELFGAGIALPCAIGCIVGFVFSGRRSIYPTQGLTVDKSGRRLPPGTTVLRRN
jgi:H+/Cl- antiporter ClcA